MPVRAKFRVAAVTKVGDQSSIQLHPVVGGSAENDAFFKYTPGGTISLSVVSAEVAEQFETGVEMYVDFTPA